jgi:hypothetical protein
MNLCDSLGASQKKRGGGLLSAVVTKRSQLASVTLNPGS